MKVFKNIKNKFLSLSLVMKIIVSFLIFIFLLVMVGTICNLYNKNLSNKLTSLEVVPNSAPSGKNKKGDIKTQKVQENIDYSTYSTCLENTKDVKFAKDCCDCLGGDESLHKACRDAAADYDFTKNTVFKTFEIPQALGKEGDYSMCTASGNQEQCKQCCEASDTKFVCGDFQYCRTACDNL